MFKKFLVFIFFLGVFIFIFWPVMKEWFIYQSNDHNGIKFSLDAIPQFSEFQLRPIEAVDKNFGIVIPKINANARVFKDIDMDLSEVYLPILAKGVAHRAGSVYPGEEGNMFLFSHAGDFLFNSRNYNQVFFLLGELINNDEIDIYYYATRYKYKVIDRVTLSEKEIKPYLKKLVPTDKTLTVQTNFPPGTSLLRLLVIAKQLD